MSSVVSFENDDVKTSNGDHTNGKRIIFLEFKRTSDTLLGHGKSGGETTHTSPTCFVGLHGAVGLERIYVLGLEIIYLSEEITKLSSMDHLDSNVHSSYGS